MPPAFSRNVTYFSRRILLSSTQQQQQIYAFFSGKSKQKAEDGPKVRQAKVKAKVKTSRSSKGEDSARLLDLLVKAYDAPHRKPPPASEEEMARRYNIGRNYVIGMFEQHNELNHDLAVKIRMKRHAIKMLPKEGEVGDSMRDFGVPAKKKKTVVVGDDGSEDAESGETVTDHVDDGDRGGVQSVYGRWRSQAMNTDEFTGPPDWRRIPMFTPPIPGFDPSIYMEEEQD